MAGGPGDKMVYLHLRSAKNNYYNCYDVLQTKSSIHGVLETILNFVVCYTQNYTFTVSCRQISHIKTTAERTVRTELHFHAFLRGKKRQARDSKEHVPGQWAAGPRQRRCALHSNPTTHHSRRTDGTVRERLRTRPDEPGAVAHASRRAPTSAPPHHRAGLRPVGVRPGAKPGAH